ncbi:unnamed protein product [Brachionus calyciflorus]|uniref:Uncharacterized protein n=1 Tax=Brachionus calyciflorus TaxID=104777 RepID=A0A814GHI6_9BILA|nr:unnamed protein product [Brachionus calyciflorus]
MHLLLENDERILQFELFINRICSKFNFDYEKFDQNNSNEINNQGFPNTPQPNEKKNLNVNWNYEKNSSETSSNSIESYTNYLNENTEERTYINLDLSNKNKVLKNLYVQEANNSAILSSNSQSNFSGQNASGLNQKGTEYSSQTTSKKTKFPDVFLFPAENLDEVLRAKLELPGVILSKCDRLKVINAIFKRLESLDIIYLSSHEYVRAIDSFGCRYPLVYNDRNPNLRGQLHLQLKNKMQVSRRKETNSKEVSETRQKYAPSTRKPRRKNKTKNSNSTSN